MMNNLGKALVLVHLALAMVALTWAAGLYLNFVDFGWNEPRLQLDKRIASELDKRTVALAHARAGVDITLPDMKKYVDELYKAREIYPQNHLFYLAEIERLKTGKSPDGKDMVFNKPRWRGDTLELTGKDPYDPPVLVDPLKGIVKSYASYHADRTALEKKIVAELVKNAEWTEKHAEISRMLNGGKDEPGLYKLIEDEHAAQEKAKAELEYLKNIWAPVLQEAEVFIQRRVRLEKTLDDLRKARASKLKDTGL